MTPVPSRTRHRLAAVLASLLASATVTAQPPEPPAVGAADQRAIVEDIAAALDHVYVFPEVAREMGALLRRNLDGDAYREITSLPTFCERLTEDLQSVSHDRHLRVRFAPPPPGAAGEEPSEAEQQERFRERARRDNYCFRKAERLAGNVGYLKFDCFLPAEVGGATAVAAMNFLGTSDALIVDVRDNGGGSPSMIQLLSSYFFEEPTHLNSFYIRKSDETKQFWTQAHVEGPRLTDVPLFVLTSGRTFSAAEEFTYNLKNLERATIVGETTGGGAHPVEEHRVEGYPIEMSLPFGRAVNPVTGTNWEGTGVEPHLQVPAAEAFDAAYAAALAKLEATTEDEGLRRELAWTREEIEARRHPVELAATELDAYTGTFGPRVITREGGALLYSRDGRPARPLVPLGNDRFLIDGVDGFRFQFERDATGRVVRVVGHYVQGHRDQNERTGG